MEITNKKKGGSVTSVAVRCDPSRHLDGLSAFGRPFAEVPILFMVYGFIYVS